MTPLHIDILIHYHTRPTEYGKEDNNFSAPAVREAIKWMVGANLLESNDPRDDANHSFRTTDRGNAYIDAMSTLPLPEKQIVWTIPGIPKMKDECR